MTTQPVSEEGDNERKKTVGTENESYFKIDPEVLSNLAAKIVTDCLGVKPGENVTIETWNHGLEIGAGNLRSK